MQNLKWQVQFSYCYQAYIYKNLKSTLSSWAVEHKRFSRVLLVMEEFCISEAVSLGSTNFSKI